VYEYIFRTAHPYIKVKDDVQVDVQNNTPNTEMSAPNERFERMELPTQTTEAAPTFLNNMEKILRVKPQGNKKSTPQERNAVSNFLNR